MYYVSHNRSKAEVSRPSNNARTARDKHSHGSYNDVSVTTFCSGVFQKSRAACQTSDASKIRAANGKWIPDMLKVLFLASNAGKDVKVIKPPPAGVIYKMFANVVKNLKQTTNNISMPSLKKCTEGHWSRRTSPSSNALCSDMECDGMENHEVGLQALEVSGNFCLCWPA